MPVKNLILLSGPMGVGKTTTLYALQEMLPPNVALDGDWCWMARPFVVTEETKEMVQGNIAHLLNSFLRCSAYENVIFCWVMNRQSIVDAVLQNLQLEGVRVHHFSLVASPDALRQRLEKDVAAGLRQTGCVEKSLSYLADYKDVDSVKVDVSNIGAWQAAQKIREAVYENSVS